VSAFLARMTAGEAIAARYKAGEIDRETALIELTIEFDGTVITELGIESFLDARTQSPTSTGRRS
jgi:hypothetical protein